MATRRRELPGGAARGPSTSPGLDARAAETLARCRGLRVRSHRLLAAGKDLRQYSVECRATAHDLAAAVHDRASQLHDDAAEFAG